MAFNQVDDEYDDDDVEIVVVPPGQDVPKEEVDDGNMVISRDELAKLRSDADDRAMLRETMQSLGTFRQPQQPANVQMPQNMETEAEFRARLSRDLLDDNKTADVLSELIDRRTGPMVQYYEKELGDMRKQLVMKDEKLGGIATKYAAEVQAELDKLPRVQRISGEGYEYAINKVKAAHLDDIVAERVAEATAKLREELGLDDGKKAGVQRKPGGESGRMAGGPTGTTRKLFMTDKIRAEAKRYRMEPEEYLKQINS